MSYTVYILASRKHGTLYIGVTNDIAWKIQLIVHGNPEWVDLYDRLNG